MDEDNRLESVADWAALEYARRFAFYWRWTQPGVQIGDLESTLNAVQVTRSAMPANLFGFVVGMGLRWRIEINDRLPLAAAQATLGHEFGHTLQRRDLRTALCAPRAGLPVVEQEAHAIGAILTVPFEAVERLPLDDVQAAGRVAVTLTLPASYIRIRAALSVFLNERDGDRQEASAFLDGMMLDHQLWMAGIADYMTALGETPPS